MPDVLIAYHFSANTGFAIEPLEIAFYEVVSELLGEQGRIHLGYTSYAKGEPRWLKPAKTTPLIELNYQSMPKQQIEQLEAYINEHNIRYVLAFDLPVGATICGAFRRAGVEQVFSYWGAPMSSVNSGVKLLLKRLQVKLTRNKPDHFIFESYGMQKTATHGRGVRDSNTSVVRLGIDVDKFTRFQDKDYVYQQFSIPEDRKILFYAGHMEERKGVRVIIAAAAELVNQRKVENVHFLICGNREGEKEAFDHLYKGTAAEQHITFAGYRDDIVQLMPGCYAGIIASTGWDSFPRSSLEMAAAGLPLLVSNLPGLNETIEDQSTGLLFLPGDYSELADKIEYFLVERVERDGFSRNAVARVEQGFTQEMQKQNLLHVIKTQTEE